MKRRARFIRLLRSTFSNAIPTERYKSTSTSLPTIDVPSANCALTRQPLSGPPRSPFTSNSLTRSLRGRLLLRSGVSFVAASRVRKALHGAFPTCLNGAPMIARPAESPVGIAIDAWLAVRGLTPRVVARCDDSALMKVFAQLGLGIVCVPTVIESDVARQFGLRRIGHVPELTDPLFLIRPSGRHAHPLLDEIEAGAAGEP